VLKRIAEAKSKAAERGHILKEFVAEALHEKLASNAHDVRLGEPIWTPSLLLRSVAANAQLESANLHASSSVSVAPSAMSASRSLRSSRSSRMCSRRKRALASFA